MNNQNDSDNDSLFSDSETEQTPAAAASMPSSSSSSTFTGFGSASPIDLEVPRFYGQRRHMKHANASNRQEAYTSAINEIRKRRMEQARNATHKRWTEFGRLSPEEQDAYMNKHRNWATVNVSDADALKRYNLTLAQQPLVPLRSKRISDDPLSYDQRQLLLAQKKEAFNKLLADTYPDIKDERDRELIFARGRKLERQITKKSHPLTPEEKIIAREKREYRQVYPNAVLMDGDVDKELQDFDGEDYDDYVNPSWKGVYPQTMPHVEREKAARTFAELTGTLGWMPTYDPKLTTKESAAKVYNSEDYDIKAYDMDMNDFTPANVIIRKKAFKKDGKGAYLRDSQGKRIPLPESEWTTIAANGYRLQDPNQNQQYGRLKTMAYYKAHPSASARREEPMGVYIQNSQIYAPKAKNALASVKKYVRSVLLDRGNTFRQSLNVSNSPILLNLCKIEKDGNKYTGIIYSMSSVAVNFLVSETSRLLCAYVIYPAVIQKKDSNRPESRLYQIFRQYAESLHPPTTGYYTDEYQNWWKNNLLEPSVEIALNRDDYLRDDIENEVKLMKRARVNTYEITTRILADIVIKKMMYYYEENLPTLLTAVGATEPFSHLSYIFSFVYGRYPQDSVNTQTVASGTTKPLPITPLRKDIIKTRHNPQYWGLLYNPNADQGVVLPQQSLPLGGGPSSSSSSSSSVNAQP